MCPPPKHCMLQYDYPKSMTKPKAGICRPILNWLHLPARSGDNATKLDRFKPLAFDQIQKKRLQFCKEQTFEMGYQNGFCHKADCFKEIDSLIFHSPQLKEMSLQSAFYLLAVGGKDVTYLIVAQPTKAIPSNKNVHPVLEAGKKKISS